MSAAASSVFFATPIYRSDPVLAAQFAQAMTNALKIPNARFGMTMTPWIDVARSSLVASFRESGCDYLFFRDHDIAFEPELLRRMLDAKADMIVAPYIVRHSNPQRFETVVENDEVIHAGLGCALIRRDVIETLWENHFDEFYFVQDGQVVVNLFDRLYVTIDTERQMWKEDRAFCWRVRNAGYKIKALSPANITHGNVTSTFCHPSNSQKTLSRDLANV